METSQPKRREWIAASVLILTISALSYLVLAGRLGFQGDDWYLAYAGKAEGIQKFWDVFASDRPFRALFVGPVFSLFGLNAALYSYFSYALRAVGGLGFFWLLSSLWPRQNRLNVLLSVMFAIYPGWMDQPAPFDYQTHLISFDLIIFSFVLTVKAMRVGGAARQAALIAGAVVLDALSLLLMEYYIGLEGLRLVLIFYLAGAPDLRGIFHHNLLARLRCTLLLAWPYLLSAGGFMVWRMFFFDNTRSATDIGGMFSSLASSPVMRGLWGLVYLVQDFLNITVLAWFVPLYMRSFNLRLRDSLIAVGLAAAAVTLALAAWYWLRRGKNSAETGAGDTQDGWDMLWIGSLGVVFSLAPIILGDRHVIFPAFGRFSLPGSLGAVIAIGGLLLALGRERLRLIVPAALIGLAVMMHYGNSVAYAESSDDLRDFWWQVAWRAPQIAPESVLVGEYATMTVVEDYIVWGPANLIYYPERSRVDGQTRTPLASVVLTQRNISDIATAHAQPDRERRGITSTQDFGKVLVITRPSLDSCVHILDGRAPELSENDRDRVYRIAARSHIDLIQTQAARHTPPSELFGGEPQHRWCYYYQMASLARQKGDWAEVARLGDEAAAKSLHPIDWVEWIPFVQGYAYTGRTADVDRLAPILKESNAVKQLARDLFTRDPLGYGKTYPEGQAYLRAAFQ